MYTYTHARAREEETGQIASFLFGRRFSYSARELIGDRGSLRVGFRESRLRISRVQGIHISFVRRHTRFGQAREFGYFRALDNSIERSVLVVIIV